MDDVPYEETNCECALVVVLHVLTCIMMTVAQRRARIHFTSTCSGMLWYAQVSTRVSKLTLYGVTTALERVSMGFRNPGVSIYHPLRSSLNGNSLQRTHAR